jgi:3-oxoacyl-[acyl-carrier-protein] synthase II
MKIENIYIGSASSISVQDTFDNASWYKEVVPVPAENARVKTPDYKQYLDPMATRRMSKILKNALLTAKQAMSSLSVTEIDGVVTATAWGCQADTTKFLDSFVTLGEELLSPTSFIQSTHNTIGGLIAMSIQCNGYNNTISHDVMSFETALLDAVLMMQEQKQELTCYVGGVEELTDLSEGIFKRTRCYETSYPISEAATCFLIHNRTDQLKKVQITDITLGSNATVLNDALAKSKPDLIISSMKEGLPVGLPVLDHRLYCGDYGTASAFALFMSTGLLQDAEMRAALGLGAKSVTKIAIVNAYSENRYSFIEVKAC